MDDFRFIIRYPFFIIHLRYAPRFIIKSPPFDYPPFARAEFCDAGMVKVNGKTAKSSKEIHQNDDIDLTAPTAKPKFAFWKYPKKNKSRAIKPSNYMKFYPKT